MMKKTGKKAARKWVLFSFWMTAAAVLPGQIRALAAESLQAGPGPAEMFRAAELPAELAYSDSLHDFTLEIEGHFPDRRYRQRHLLKLGRKPRGQPIWNRRLNGPGRQPYHGYHNFSG